MPSFATVASAALLASSAFAVSISNTTTTATANSSAAGIVASRNSTALGASTSTEVVTAFTTYCPEPTTICVNAVCHTVTEATTLTITDCPCTLTHTFYTEYVTLCESSSTTPVANAVVKSTTTPVAGAVAQSSTTSVAPVAKASTASTGVAAANGVAKTGMSLAAIGAAAVLLL